MKTKFVVPLIVAIFTFVLATGRFPKPPQTEASTPSQDTDGLKVKNLTRAFVVVQASRNKDIVRMTFRNDYDKVVNGFTLSGGPNSGVQVDLLSSQHEIAPGRTYQYQFFASNLEPSGSSLLPLFVSVLNVIFEDGAGDGDEATTALIYNRRLGEQAAVNRVIPLFGEVLNGSGEVQPKDLKTLRERISAACQILKKEQPSLVRGIQHAETRVLQDLEQIEDQLSKNQSNSGRDRLFETKTRYGREAAKLGLMKAKVAHN